MTLEEARVVADCLRKKAKTIKKIKIDEEENKDD